MAKKSSDNGNDAGQNGAPTSKYVCVVSDATGRTAKRVVSATLAQFDDADVVVDVVGKVNTIEGIQAVVDRTRRRGGLIAYTLVEPNLRREIASLANERGVETIDLIGPLLTALGGMLTTTPSLEPGLYTEPGEDHWDLLEAVSFTVKHDDGMCANELDQADIVITGPSRTAKTPLSAYLAHTRGLKVANVPLALGIEPLESLKQINPRRVVGLSMRAGLLAEIRRTRLGEMGNPDIEYAQLPYVEKELRHCHEIYRSSPAWSVVDVTGKSIEEIAAQVCALTQDSSA